MSNLRPFQRRLAVTLAGAWLLLAAAFVALPVIFGVLYGWAAVPLASLPLLILLAATVAAWLDWRAGRLTLRK